MLTPANTLLLGIIANAPANPYDIVRRFEYNRYAHILQIPNSTIYANIRRMHRQGFTQYSSHRNGEMPARKIYSITPTGLDELRQSIASYLSDYHPDWTGFNVSVFLMHHFDRDELLEMLRARLAALEVILQQRTADLEFVSEMQTTVPCVPNLAGALHVANHIESELSTTRRTIGELERATGWPHNTFQVDDSYRAYYQEVRGH